jgi:hypothetical protein
LPFFLVVTVNVAKERCRMTRPFSIVPLMTLIGSFLAPLAGCSGVDDGGSEIADPDSVASDNSATDEAGLTWSVRHRRLSASRARATTSTSTSSGTTSSGNASTLDPASVAASAQTPDGAAIPQPAGPNGQCPDVVVAFGFWSCPNLNEQCSFTAGGTTTRCTCTRTDGEGQFFSWVCGS